jgi:hypothetical protein
MPRILGLYALIAVAALAYTAYWFVLADRSEALVDDALADWRGRGYALSYTERSTSGYPYRLSTRVGDFTLLRDGGRWPWAWHGERLTLTVQPWDLRHYVAVLEGVNRIDLPPAGGGADVELTAESARASLILDGGWRAQRGSAELRQAVLRGAPDSEGVTFGRIEAHARRPEAGPDSDPDADPDASLDAVVEIDALRLPDGAGGPLGREIARILVEGTVLGPLPEALEPAPLAAWRDAGGFVDAHKVALDWGPVRIAGDGTFTLDALMRPLGAFSSRIVGFDALIDRLAAAGRMSEDAAAAAHLAFALIAKTPEGGGAPVLTVPITLQDGWLFAGPVRMFEVGPVMPAPAG